MKTLILGFCLLSVSSVWAGGTEFLVNDSAAAFQRGNPKDTHVTSLGVLTLSRKLTDISTDKEALFWCLAADRSGAVYAGTVEGKVLRVSPGRSEELLNLPEAGVFSLLWVNDALYAGTGPGGTVYRIKPGSKAEKFCQTGEGMVWALATDGKGNLIAGTGPNGKVLRISPEGKVEPLLDSPEDNVLCVAVGSDGVTYAGTDGRGLVYRIAPDGSPQVAYDAAESEVRVMTLDEAGNLYFGTAETKTGPRRPTPASPPSSGPPGPSASETKSSPAGRPAPSFVGRLSGTVSATNAIYRLDPKGMVLKLAPVEKLMVLSLAWTSDGIYFGTGNSGRLGRIGSNLEVEWIKEDLQSQVLAILAMPNGGLILGTGGEGHVTQFGPELAGVGEYLSQILDADFVSKFGVISWQARIPQGSGIEITTRSGNVGEVDDSWSAFSEAYADAKGSVVTNPPARFIQYKVKMTSTGQAAPEIDAVRIAYLATNQPPRVTGVQVGAAAQKSSEAKAKPKNPSSQGNISWEAEDPNGDTMHYAVYFRAADGTLWKELGKDLTETKLTWDTGSVPDGRYRVKVVADDSADNPPDRALTGEKVSAAVTVDNTRPVVAAPVVKSVGKGAVEITATASDVVSRITSAEYSIDSGQWKMVEAEDGLMDESSESFRFKADGLAAGDHVVTLRVTDESGNIGVAGTEFKVGD